MFVSSLSFFPLLDEVQQHRPALSFLLSPLPFCGPVTHGGLGLGVGTWKDTNISYLAGVFLLYAVTLSLVLTKCLSDKCSHTGSLWVMCMGEFSVEPFGAS